MLLTNELCHSLHRGTNGRNHGWTKAWMFPLVDVWALCFTKKLTFCRLWGNTSVIFVFLKLHWVECGFPKVLWSLQAGCCSAVSPWDTGQDGAGGTWEAVAVWTLLDSPALNRANEKTTGETTLSKKRWWRASFEQMPTISSKLELQRAVWVCTPL